jgi:hypothetical protein
LKHAIGVQATTDSSIYFCGRSGTIETALATILVNSFDGAAWKERIIAAVYDVG